MFNVARVTSITGLESPTPVCSPASSSTELRGMRSVRPEAGQGTLNLGPVAHDLHRIQVGIFLADSYDLLFVGAVGEKIPRMNFETSADMGALARPSGDGRSSPVTAARCTAHASR